MWRFFPFISLPASKPGGSMAEPLFPRSSRSGCPGCRRWGSPRAWPVRDISCRARDASSLTCRPAPLAEIAVHRATRGQVLRDVAPLAAGAQHIHYPVDHLTHVGGALATAALSRRDQRLDMRPLRIGEVAWITQLVAVVAVAVLGRPHRAPRQRVPRSESQPTEPLQALIGSSR